MATAGFQLGFQTGRAEREQKRQHQQGLEDEQRQSQVLDFYNQRNVIREKVAKQELKPEDAKGALDKIEFGIGQLYHPTKAPGALEKDWDWLKGLFGHKGGQITTDTPPDLDAAAGTPGTTLSPATAGEALSSLPTEKINLAATEAYKPGPGQKTEPGTLATQIELPTPPVKLPSSTLPTVSTPDTPYERKLRAAQKKASDAADLDVEMAKLTMGPSPDEQAKLDYDKLQAGITGKNKLIDSLPGATDQEKKAMKDATWRAALGLPVTQKYASQLAEFSDLSNPNVKKYYRVPLELGAPLEEVGPPGMVMTNKKSSGSGTDFAQTLASMEAVLGHPATFAQRMWLKQKWATAGAHGTARSSTTDAAGRVVSVSNPIFPAGTAIPPEALDFSDMPPEIGGTGAASPKAVYGSGGGGGQGAAPQGAPATGGGAGQLPPAGPAWNLPSTIAPSGLIASPDTPDAQAAMAEAQREGVLHDVMAVAHYLAPPAQMSGRTGSKPFMDLVYRINPSFDAGQWPAIQEGRKSFATGKDGAMLRDFGTTVGHLDGLISAYNALGNGPVPALNRAKNAGRVAVGYGGVADVGTAATSVASEMGKFYKGASPTDPELDDWKSKIDPNMSPDAFHKSTIRMVNLMGSRMVSEAQMYVNTFGTLKGFPRLSPEAANVLRRTNTEGAKQILEIDRQAMVASGQQPSAPGWPTTAPPPSAPPPPRGGAPQAAPPPAPTAPAARPAGAPDHRVSRAEIRQSVPAYKSMSDDDLSRLISQQGLMPVP